MCTKLFLDPMKRCLLLLLLRWKLLLLLLLLRAQLQRRRASTRAHTAVIHPRVAPHGAGRAHRARRGVLQVARRTPLQQRRRRRRRILARAELRRAVRFAAPCSCASGRYCRGRFERRRLALAARCDGTAVCAVRRLLPPLGTSRGPGGSGMPAQRVHLGNGIRPADGFKLGFERVSERAQLLDLRHDVRHLCLRWICGRRRSSVRACRPRGRLDCSSGGGERRRAKRRRLDRRRSGGKLLPPVVLRWR
mmetsp:Transcript_3740/g.10535  ORF Transcript_3740/g.10535 Transcript_3740/m.10535 type:complete len:249 (+) Transcript_3740:83-829(+)